MVHVAGWERFEWLRHGFTTRAEGTMTLDGGNRETMLREVGLQRLATVRQVHGDLVVPAGKMMDADGLVTAEPGLGVGVMTADCVPVLVADTRLRVVGAFHAGWRGTAAGIAENGIARMQEDFGCRVEDLVAAVGPSIGPCCYEVAEEFQVRFAADLFAGRRLDLWEANRRQLVGMGVPEVTVVEECTACGVGTWFSHRAEHGRAGRLMAVIGVA